MAHHIGPRAQLHRRAIAEDPIRLHKFVVIGEGTFVGRYTYFNDYTTCSYDNRIGRFCSIARHVEIGAIEHPTGFLSTHPFQYKDWHFAGDADYDALPRTSFDQKPGAVIGNDVWIGSKAIIARGVTIGHGAIIAAGSFVNRDVAPYQIVAGTPARPLRFRFDADTRARLLASRWWDRPLTELSGLPFDDITAALARLDAMPPPDPNAALPFADACATCGSGD